MNNNDEVYRLCDLLNERESILSEILEVQIDIRNQEKPLTVHGFIARMKKVNYLVKKHDKIIDEINELALNYDWTENKPGKFFLLQI